MHFHRRHFMQAAAAFPLPAMAQGAWPNKPIKLLLGFAPGGPPDVVARLVANGLTERLGPQVVVENKPGAKIGRAHV